MDFLRRLAPPDQHDAARATPLLPSRFAVEAPLRAIPAPAQRDQSAGEDDVMPGPAPLRSPAARTAPSAVPATAARQDAHSGPRPGPRMPVHAEHLADLPSAVRAYLPDAAVANAPAAGDRRAAEPARALKDGREPQRPAVAPAGQRAQPAPSPAAVARQAAPLSPAILAQRVAGSVQEQVVHVTIGRIDVVASVAPAPAAARAPKRAAEPAPLADYLRGANRGRR